ncbi:hypothetical protein GGS23DRAFT_238199 [Durotheca rogersii]|uniref:uncharacterized protein n=1 Tax=Durotheca rogersii TaxID=419775 RepID=UPI002220435F|nr:uncharacterized protein GGS23DRAFT_238199 [Durotheca rogersii]KAI5860183.1 hypothetical protein GGS23DRAFT_238199 [Durotheca rogersii]
MRGKGCARCMRNVRLIFRSTVTLSILEMGVFFACTSGEGGRGHVHCRILYTYTYLRSWGRTYIRCLPTYLCRYTRARSLRFFDAGPGCRRCLSVHTEPVDRRNTRTRTGGRTDESFTITGFPPR